MRGKAVGEYLKMILPEDKSGFSHSSQLQSPVWVGIVAGCGGKEDFFFILRSYQYRFYPPFVISDPAYEMVTLSIGGT